MPSNKPQIRRCSVCDTVGHNKATCPNVPSEPVSTLPATTTPTSIVPKVLQPVKFFVHHVNTPPPASPHVVDLKNEKNDIWKIVESAAPEKNEDLFHSYHKKTVENPTPLHARLYDDDPDDSSLKKETLLQFDDEVVPVKAKSEIIEKKETAKIPVEKIFHSEPIFKKRSFNFHPIETVKNLTAKIPLRPVAAAIAVFALLIVLPGPARGYYNSLTTTKNSLVENSTAGFLALIDSTTALKSANLLGAEESTNAALQNFNTALQTIETKHEVLQNIIAAVPILNGEIESREKILLSGQEIAVGNSYLISALKEITAASNTPVTSKLNHLVGALKAADPNYEQARLNLNAVNPEAVPYEYREQFKSFRTLFGTMVQSFKNIASLNDSLQEIFGGKGLRRYLVVFQNPAELRPTGGFLGSFAIMDVKDGAITNLDIPAGGSYDLQGQLRAYVVPPTPLLLTNKRWEFQDANWFPDFPASAEKMLWFFNQSRNMTADGVIAVNATVLERLLSIIGPVTDPTRNVTLSSSTALTTLQTIVETGPEKKDNKPKQIIADLAPRLLDSISKAPAKTLLPILNNFASALEEKEIQAYFTDPAAENTVTSSGWGGTIAEIKSDSDYLNVINTNLQGQKSDARIKQTISHQAEISDGGTIIDTVVITREHTGVSGEDMYGQPNIDYIRVYTPKGSTLLSASGFTWPDEKAFRAPESWYSTDVDLSAHEEQVSIDNISGTKITNEFGKTAFGNWVVTEPGSVSRIQFTYRLPFSITVTGPEGDSVWEKVVNSFDKPISHYQLVVQKQSGITSDFESQIIFPDSWQPDWQSGTNISLAKNGMRILPQPLLHDSVWSILMKKDSQ